MKESPNAAMPVCLRIKRDKTVLNSLTKFLCSIYFKVLSLSTLLIFTSLLLLFA